LTCWIKEARGCEFFSVRKKDVWLIVDISGSDSAAVKNAA
jgi:hypothetical protein